VEHRRTAARVALPERPIVHEVEEVDLRSVFPREDRTFNPWLSQPDNLARLARVLGIDLMFEEIEKRSDVFRTDILARARADGSTVAIENQFGRSDHDHFGKAMTYVAGHEAKTVTGLAERFADTRRRLWSALIDRLVGVDALTGHRVRYGGALRFLWVLPPVAAA
jgi:hypothetical protein